MTLYSQLKDKASEQLPANINRYQLNVADCSSPIDVEDFSGYEGLSQLYCYDINFTSTDRRLDSKQLIGKTASLIMGTGPLHNINDHKRVHGVLTDFSRITSSADQTQYRVTLKPFLALLDNQFRTHRFFVNKSVPEVVTQILQDHGFKGWEYEFNLKQSYPKREQINQYRESDLDFICRLLAEVGIFFYFRLQEDARTEVVWFGDSQTALRFGKTVPLMPPSGMSDGGADSVWGLNISHSVVEAGVTAADYNHRQAQSVLRSAEADMTRGDGEGITYGSAWHYLLRHTRVGDSIDPEAETANFYARLDHERFLTRQTVITGISTYPLLAAAEVVSITDSAVPATLPDELQQPVLLIRTGYRASRRSALQVSFAAVPYSETLCWRPPLLPRPKVSGTLTARITSAKAHDIYAWQDSAGLYRVAFDADKDDKPAGQESMPVRLAKPYGGDRYGFHFPLIQGTEVAIAFHEGDPDRPYIAHALHDSRHVDHVTDLNSTRNVIRTAGLNKLRMEDKRGEEHIKLSTEYGGKTQLNLGHNVDAQRKLRGEGAELRTDRHISVRGGAGVFITADGQSVVHGQMMAMSEAVSQLQQAQMLTEALRAAAETAKAELADLQTQKSLFDETLKEMKQSAILLSAPAGIAAVTPKSLQISAGENLTMTGGKNADVSVMKKFTLAAGEAVSLFAQKLGIKLFAAKGKVEIQAQDDEMALDALKDVRISSSNGTVVIRAKQEILLVGSGGAYIRIGNGEVESGAPDKIIQRAAVWQKFGGKSAGEVVQEWEHSKQDISLEVLWPFDNKPVKNDNVKVSDSAGTSNLTTNNVGETKRHKSLSVDRVDFETREVE